jgi:alpha-N-arabinofuranosidase
VKWIDGWPVINPDHDEVQFHYLAPLPLQKPGHYFPLAGNFSWQDDFFASSLDRHWVFLRTVRDRWYDLATRKGALAMKVRPETCTDPVNPSFIGHRQQHINSEMIVALDFHAVSENEKAGLVVFQSEFSFLYIAKSILGSSPVVQVFKSPAAEGQPMELLATEPLEQERGLLSLKIESKGGLYDFCFSYNNKAWNPILKEVDGTFLSTRTAGGFVGCVYAMYATSLGKASSNIAYFEWARYSGRDQALD